MMLPDGGVWSVQVMMVILFNNKTGDEMNVKIADHVIALNGTHRREATFAVFDHVIGEMVSMAHREGITDDEITARFRCLPTRQGRHPAKKQPIFDSVSTLVMVVDRTLDGLEMAKFNLTTTNQSSSSSVSTSSGKKNLLEKIRIIFL